MAVSNLVVVGASAGGVKALTTLVAGLEKDIDAAILVVLHLPPAARSSLHELLSKAGPLPASQANHDEFFVAGRIYVARPDHHLLVEGAKLKLSRGPRENHVRPAIDALFCSAAKSHGDNVIGVILSGTLHDGAVGLRVIRAHGGTTIVQDPREAAYSGMPQSAIAASPIDYVLPVGEIGRHLSRIAGEAPLPARQVQQ
jgi:two-component system, chemotaxis family, protein-glutamate methylesterase/glutaminase